MVLDHSVSPWHISTDEGERQVASRLLLIDLESMSRSTFDMSRLLEVFGVDC